MEILSIAGRDTAGELAEVGLAAEDTAAYNPAFDVTPRQLVTSLVTEHGCFETTDEGMAHLRDIVAA